MAVHTCALTGQGIDTKAYILRTTEGEEIVSPEALFHPDADANLGELIADLVARIGKLEAALEERNEAMPKAPPAAKTAAAKKTPAQRKAVD